MSKGRVVFAWRRLTPPFFLGGAEVSVRILSRLLVRAGYDVKCVGSYANPRSGHNDLPSGSEVWRRAGLEPPRVASPEELSYQYEGVDCKMVPQARVIEVLSADIRPDDVVVAAQEECDGIVELARKRHAVTVGWLHSSSEVGLMVLRARPMHVLCTSRFVWQRAQEAYDHTGIVFYPPFEDAQARRKDNADRLTLVNPIPEKGGDIFLELARLCPRHRFVAVEGWHVVELPSEDLQRNVEYVPRQMDLGAVFASSRVLLVPSRLEEGFGRVVVEAGLYGVPSIVSSRGGLMEAAGRGSVVLDTFEVEAWHRAILDLNEGDRYERDSRAAREDAMRFLRDPVKELEDAGVI